MKAFAFLFFLLPSITFANSGNTCENEALMAGQKYYKEVCGGWGADRCQIKNIYKNTYELGFDLKCSFIDVDEDYIENFQALLILDRKSCDLLFAHVIECEQN